mgnify:CR=1 FL=1
MVKIDFAWAIGEEDLLQLQTVIWIIFNNIVETSTGDLTNSNKM